MAIKERRLMNSTQLAQYLDTLGIKQIKVWKSTSPSQITTYRCCRRKWWLEKVGGLIPPPSTAQMRGTEKHTHLENYLLGKAPLTDSVCVAGLPFLPEPKSVKPEDVEHRFTFEHPELPVPLRGVIDLIEHPRRITDHKTTASFEYMKSEMELAGDPQAVAYSVYAADKIFGGNGVVRFRLIYYRTRGSAAADEVKVEMDAETRERGWGALVATSNEMALDAVKEDPRTVECNSSACADFGGCPHRKLCALMGTSSMGTLTGLLRPATMEVQMTEKAGSFLDALRKRKAAEAAAANGEAPVIEPGDKGGIVPPDAPPETSTEQATPAPEVEKPPEVDQSEDFPFGVPPKEDDDFMEAMRQGGHKNAKKSQLVQMTQRACHISGNIYPEGNLKKDELLELLTHCLGTGEDAAPEGPPDDNVAFVAWLGTEAYVELEKLPLLAVARRAAALAEYRSMPIAAAPDSFHKHLAVCYDRLKDVEWKEDAETEETAEPVNEAPEIVNETDVVTQTEPPTVPESDDAFVAMVRDRQFGDQCKRSLLVKVIKRLCELAGAEMDVEAMADMEKSQMLAEIEDVACEWDLDAVEKEKAAQREIEEAREAAKAVAKTIAKSATQEAPGLDPAWPFPADVPRPSEIPEKEMPSKMDMAYRIEELMLEAQRLWDEKQMMSVRGMGTELFVNCHPRRPEPDAPPVAYLDIFLIPFQEKVADEAKVPHYALIKFNEGPKRVAALLRQAIREGVVELPPRLICDRRMPCTDVVLESLIDQYDRIIERI